MIVGTLATYPPRQSSLVDVVRRVAPQLDVLRVVLNSYSAPIAEISGLPNVQQILPPVDLKATGKFYPDIGADDVVFLFDDDILYPDDYVRVTLGHMNRIGMDRAIFGYHASLYVRPAFGVSKRRFRAWRRRNDRTYLPEARRVFSFRSSLDVATEVEQIGTGTLAGLRKFIAPFDYVRTAQQFVDVRHARWCHEQGLKQIALPRQAGWLPGREFEETIYKGFTLKSPAHVLDEVATYAFKLGHRSDMTGRKRRKGGFPWSN